MKRILFSLIIFGLGGIIFAEGYEPGDKADDFSLKNVDGKYVSLADYKDAKGFIVIFTCNHCPYAKAYEQRIIDLDNEFSDKGFPVVAIQPNSPEAFPADSFENMVKRAEEKKYPFPYLIDKKQEVYKKYGATKTPTVFLLERNGDILEVAYIGTIDDNYKDATKVTTRYIADAVNSLLAGQEPVLKSTRAIGCGIK